MDNVYSGNRASRKYISCSDIPTSHIRRFRRTLTHYRGRLGDGTDLAPQQWASLPVICCIKLTRRSVVSLHLFLFSSAPFREPAQSSAACHQEHAQRHSVIKRHGVDALGVLTSF